MKKLTQNAIAAGLGISASMLSRLKKRGMPVDSLPAAHAWRNRHLKTSLTKEYRYTPWHQAPFRAAPLPKPIGADGINALGLLAKNNFDDHADALRRAMRRLPLADRSLVLLAFEVWEALCGPQIKKFEDYEKDQGIEPCPPPANKERSGPEYDPDDIAGNFMYEIAAGIICFNESLATLKK